MNWKFAPAQQKFDPAQFRIKVKAMSPEERAQCRMDFQLRLRRSATPPDEKAELKQKIGIIDEVDGKANEKFSRQLWGDDPDAKNIFRD